ncbi:MAG: hypothetical protein QM747_13815 [Nocardioides sp.]
MSPETPIAQRGGVAVVEERRVFAQDADDDLVFARLRCGGDFEVERRVAAPVFADEPAVQPHPRGEECRAEGDEQAMAEWQLGAEKTAAVERAVDTRFRTLLGQLRAVRAERGVAAFVELCPRVGRKIVGLPGVLAQQLMERRRHRSKGGTRPVRRRFRPE